ncbi:hypothetical protein BDV12DRAFT_210358 [Aspergillus spectabilis]
MSDIATVNPESSGENIITSIKSLLRVFHRSSRSRRSLENLPNQILINIFGHLNVLDKACLTLTCKSFHFIFKDIFENEAFRFPRLYQLQLTDAGQFGVIRDSLLHRSQDRQMKYCVKCMMLHRREAFAKPTYHGPMMSRDYCWTEAGIVDLCPCIALTVYLRLKIIRSLMRYARGNTTTLKGTPALLFGFVMYEGRPALIHVCEISGHAYVAARIKTVVYIGGGSCGGRPNGAFQDALYNLLWAVITSVKGLLLDDMPCSSECDQGMVRLETLDVVRSLGSCGLPVDRHWVQQDQLMSPSFVRLML